MTARTTSRQTPPYQRTATAPGWWPDSTDGGGGSKKGEHRDGRRAQTTADDRELEAHWVAAIEAATD